MSALPSTPRLTVDIHSPSVAAAAEFLVDRLVEERVASSLANQDPTLWGPRAQAEAVRRLAWVTLPKTSRPLLATIDALWSQLYADGIDRVVLAGMGGSSLAPEVICRTLDRPLTVLDTTDPRQVRAALADRLERTVVVVASKSGSTVETDSHRRVYWQAFEDAGLVKVIPDSGTDGFVGIAGTLSVNVIDGKHFYDFLYSFPTS